MSDRLERFLRERVTKNPETGCWEVSGYATKYGYTRLKVGHDNAIRSHRFVYERFVGPIPEGLEIDHLCRNTSCCNPDHLEAVTHTENMRRRRQTECNRGHALEPGNVYWKSEVRNGRRHWHKTCRTCALEMEKARKARRRLAARAEAMPEGVLHP